MADRRENRGVSVRSITACLFAMVATALCVQFFEIIEASANGLSRHAVPVAAMMILIPLLVVVGVLSWISRFNFLSRQEMLSVFFCAMMTAPLASTGFWMMLIGPMGTIPKTAYFEVYDALPRGLWPHSGNLLENALKDDTSIHARQGSVSWKDIALDETGPRPMPVIDNEASGDRAYIRLAVPIAGEGDDYSAGIVLGEPYMLSVLMRPGEMGSGAEYYCRVYTGGREDFDAEVFTGRSPGERNYLHPEGFMRRGIYGLSLPAGTEGPVEIEIGLEGEGRLEIAGAELVGVGALDAIYRGRTALTKEQRAELPPGPLPKSLLLRPDNRWGWEGIKARVAGAIPWDHWLRPFASWYFFGLLVLLGTLALAAIFHRQWIDNERYPLPNAQIPALLIGPPGEEVQQRPSVFSGIWKNPAVWIGLGLSLFWCLMKGWHLYNTNVPNMNIEVDLSPYFTDSVWGRTWRGEEVRNVTFHVTAIMLSIAIFMELNVLFSLVLGFALFRMQYLVGEMGGMAAQQDYPHFREQQIGAVLMYGLLILILARKHLWRTLGEAVTGKDGDRGIVSYRSAWALLALCFPAILLWSSWNGIAPMGMLIFFGFVLLAGLVAMKLRAECGIVTGWFGPVAVAGIIPITGGMLLYQPEGVIFICIASYALFQYLFFMTPGMQVEMMELGRRYLMPARDLVVILLLGTAGALFLSGWMHMALGFSIGGDNYAQRWPYMDKTFILHDYNEAIAEANLTLEESGEAAAGGFKAKHKGYIFGGGVTVVLTMLRQAFSGFWFHPIGFIVGSTPMMELAWGSILAAAIIRYTTFKLGGAMAVRTKLMPFFVGVFVGAVLAYLIFAGISAYFHFYHPEVMRRGFGTIF